MSRAVVFGAAVAALALAAAFAAPSVAPPAEETTARADRGAAFSLLVGAWSGEGTLFGSTGSFAMEWSASGADAFRLRYSNPALRAEATYEIGPDGTATGTWSDDRPATLSLRARLSDSVVVSEWSNAEESGRTEYRIMPDGTARTRDWVGASQEPFAEATYRRSSGR